MSELAERALEAARRRAAEALRSELRARGVVATPPPVARCGLARVDELLIELGVAGGLSSERVVVLDPALGTGVWLAALLERTRARRAPARLIGVDDDPSAIAAAHALLGPEAARQGTELELRCANTLELAAPFPAGDQVRVIVGNPPWAARSRARGGPLSDAWLAEFRRDAAGAPLGERRAGVLSDDYVRFFRWALEQARRAPAAAVVCLATNGSFIDGPVHRGMRSALVSAFDRIELLDLGGNALLSRGDRRDENVFGVRVGAALTWAVRAGVGPRAARVGYGRLQGSRAEKLDALTRGAGFGALAGGLREGDASGSELASHAPCAPWFRFRPPCAGGAEEGFSLAEAFPFQREGVQTNRDALAIAGSREELSARLWAIVRGELALAPRRHFEPERARRALAAALERQAPCIEPLAYRPLDDRVFASVAPFCHRPRSELVRAVAHSPLCLLAVRKERGAAAFNLFAPARLIADACFLSARSSCRTRVFPSHTPEGAENLAPALSEQLARRVAREVTSAALIEYVLGVLGSPRFRATHEEALKSDYARIPWPRDAPHFERAASAGRAFVAALWGPLPAALALAAGVAPNQTIDRAALRYDASTERVTLAGRVLIAGVEPAWWAVRVGHHAFVQGLGRSRPARARELAALLARAARWSRAEALADAVEDGAPAQRGCRSP